MRSGWATMGSSWSSRGMFQQPGGSIWEVWGPNSKLGSLRLQQQSLKETQITSSCEKQQGFCLPGRNSWSCREPLKGQHTKFHLQPLTLDSSRGRAEWTREACGDSGVGGSGKRAEGTATGNPVLSHSPYITLRQSTSLPKASGWGETLAPPAGITLPHPVELKPGCLLKLN